MGLVEWKELPGASSLCGACRDVCPVRLDIPRMLLSLRDSANRRDPAPLELRLGMKAFGRIASRPRLYRMFAAMARAALRSRARDGWVASAPGLAAGWTRVRDLKAPAKATFQDLWRARR
jgi:L-lactate dehydrogenase complex protein LldF